MEKLTIRSIPQIFEDVIIDGITKRESYDDIRDRVVTVFRDEVMGQMKWRLRRMCNRYKQTLNLLSDEDLAMIWDDEDGGEDWDGDEKTAEWPELNETEGK